MMLPLEKSLRGKLEKTVEKARDLAETAARAVLENLGVGEPQTLPHLSEDEKDLRRKLRVHGRQLGDERDDKGAQSLERLVEEVAYEHWHRMLFARYLAENDLLMYPDPDEPVAVSLEECEDLAADEGAKNGWELAARYAARMLPQIFRLDSPVLKLSLSPEHQQGLERLVEALPIEVFSASDSLGWVYQFWQAKRKEEVNASEVKIGARELPAVTQLFTEPYMVSFLLDNSLGAWWAARRLSEHDLATASSEEELRQKASISGVSLEYLRFVREGDGPWEIAAGKFEGWPEQLSELKSLDPCCGSGHFLVAALLMLTPMRMELEGLSAREAVDAVLRDNLNGLELDQRCVELAAFALAMTAWKYPEAGGYRPLPELSVACSGLSVSVAKEEWKKLGLGKKNLSIALDYMHETFEHAPVLGSLLDPAKSDAAKMMGVSWDELSSTLTQALGQEQSEESLEAAVVAQGLAKAAVLLSGKYHWVLTNVPYLKFGKQEDVLKTYCEENYRDSKSDLATVFLERCLELSLKNGSCSIVLPQNWLYSTGYSKLREKLLKMESWNFVARLGAKGFQTPMWDFNVQLITLTRGQTTVATEMFGESAISGVLRGVDVSEPKTAAEKSEMLLTAKVNSVEQHRQLENLQNRVLLDGGSSSETEYLGTYSSALFGSGAGDKSRFTRSVWELMIYNHDAWEFFQSTPKSTTTYSGRDEIILWQKEKGDMYKLAESVKHLNHKAQQWRSGKPNWNKRGVVVSLMNKLPVALYHGEIYATKCTTIIPTDQTEQSLTALWEYCSSKDFFIEIRCLNPKLAVEVKELLQVPFDLDHWTKVAQEKYPNGLPAPYTDDPTQWIFHGHPCGSVIWNTTTKLTDHAPQLRTDDTVLHIAIARLLGYRWPAELDPDMELAPQQREWVNRTASLNSHADEDGIVCIPSVRGEAAAADRLLNLLAAAYGSQWSSAILDQLLAASSHAGKTLESWLRDKFFTQHCKLFGHRPFIWHIWDGLNDGFSALINYHKLDYKTLETLIYTYLGDWITRQQDNDRKAGLEGDGEKTTAAKNLKQKLELILEGEAPYDIFVRWKPLDQQPVGWNPDLNDGVRMNIRPFLSVPPVKKKDAGVLKDKPNIKWGKDRGKDVESAPWFHKFKGDRINDHHLTLEEKK